jgi:hypothetical protein
MIGRNPDCHLFLARAFVAGGWQVRMEIDVEAALALAEDRPTLILLTDADGAAEAAGSLRARSVVAASVPILALADTGSAEPADGIDAYLTADLAPAALVAEAQSWQPDEELATVARLEAAFGSHEIGALLERFRGELVRTLAALDWYDMADTAHRLAGIAGTLGFAAVSRDWLAVSEGEAVDRHTIYRHLRVAIATIDRVASGASGA